MASPAEIALQHYSDRAALTDATGQALTSMWAEVDPDDIAGSWAVRLAEAEAVVAGAQLAAAQMAEPYMAEVAAAEGFGEGEALVRAAGFSGIASDARGLTSLLWQPVVGSLLAVRSGAGVPMALASGHATLAMIGRTQVADAGRLADQAAFAARKEIQGYVRVVFGNACSRCIVLAGKFYRWSSGFDRHPNCHCGMMPAAKGPGKFLQDPRAMFDRMSARERSLAGWSKADQKALAEGADLNQVTNARRGLYTAGGRLLTREGTSRSATFGGFDVDVETGRLVKRPSGSVRRQRLSVDQIYADAGDDRDEAIRLLQKNGYLFGKPARPAAPTALPVAAEVDPALKLTIAQLKQIARDANVPLFGATKKADIVLALRDREMVYKTKIAGLPEWKPPKPVKQAIAIEAPPLGVPAADGPVLTGSALSDWSDWFMYDRREGRHRFVDAAGNTPAEGIRVKDLRVSHQGNGSYVADHGTAWSFDGVAYLVEHGPDDFGTPWVSRALADLRAAHDQIPAARLANKSYTAVMGANPADEYWKVKYNDPSHISAMVAGNGHITIWNFKAPYSRVKVDLLRHETGHNLDDLIGRTAVGSESAEWSAAALSDMVPAAKITDLTSEAGHGGFGKVEPGRGFPAGVSSYGRSSVGEDFAESVRYYQQGVIAQGRLKPGAEIGPVYFRDLYPARAKILDTHFPEIAKAQKAEIKALRAAKPPGKAVAAAASVDLSKLKVPELRVLAKERGISGYSRLTKPQLLDRLGTKSEAAAVAGGDLRKMTVTQLRALAKQSGLRGYSKLTKPQLVEQLGVTPKKIPGAAAPKTAQRVGPVPVFNNIGTVSADSGVAVRDELLQAKNNRELAKAFTSYARALSPKSKYLEVSFAGLDTRTAAEYAEGILRCLEFFPEARLFKVATWRSATGPYGNAYARAGGREIEFNASHAAPGKREILLASLRREAATGWSVRNSGSPAAVAIHEFGHILEMDELGKLAEREVMELVSQTAKAKGTTASAVIKAEISEYAITDARELAAEAFMDVVVNGLEASTLSREIFDILLTRYREKYP